MEKALDVIARLDREVDAFSRRTRLLNEPLTPARARLFVAQHRLNSRERNSRMKLTVATNCPDWDLRLRIIAASAQEIIADDEFGHGRPHWALLEDVGVAIGMAREEIANARPLDSTQVAWLAWEALTKNRHWLEGLVANTCSERSNIPGYGHGDVRELGWFPAWGPRWRELFGLTEEQTHFFAMHGPADVEHSNTA